MRRSAALCLGLLLGIVGRAHATSTLAWSKVVDVNTSGLAIECADAFGNLYASFSALGYFTVTKFDPYGAQVWSNSEFAGHAFAVYLIAADPVGNVYALGVENTTTTPQTLDLFKFGVDGTPQWIVQQTFASQIIPLTIQADSAGVRVAFGLRVGTAPATLGALYYETNGMQTASVTDTTVTPSVAKFCLDTNLLYSGTSVSNPGTGRCRLVEPNGTFLVDFSSVSGTCSADSDASDNVYIAGNNSGQATFQLLKFTPTGTLVFISNPANGFIDFITTANDNQIFVYGSLLQLFDPDIVPFPAMGAPAPVFSESASVDSIAADPGGGVVTAKGNVFRRYDLTGALTWAQTFTVANGSFVTIHDFRVPATSGQLGPDPVYFAGYSFQGGSTLALFAGKYVANTAVLQLTLSPTYVTGGSPTIGTVKLSAPAGMGGATVAVSSSAPGLANPPATLTIPQGGTSGTFAASTPPVDVANPVTLTATFGGVKRSAVVNVIPATLFSVTTPVSMVKGGTYVTGTVNLTGRAGPAGRSAAVSSSNSAAASVPPGVNVAPYASSVNFVIATKKVTANTAVTITARSGTVTKTATLTVTP